MDNILEKSKIEKLVIEIETNHPDEDKFQGVILDHNTNFVTFCESKDFIYDGIVFLPKNRITNCRYEDTEECYNNVIRHNGLDKDLITVKWINDVPTFYDILASIKRNDIWPIIEAITDNESFLYIGPIVSIQKDFVEINCYDAAGVWEAEYEIDYKDIFKIQIFDKYSKYFNNYMQTSNKIL